MSVALSPAPSASPEVPPAPSAPPPAASRADEDRFLWEAFRYHSRTFSLATRFLPRPVRLPVATLYLYCRTVDTLADERALDVGQGQALKELDALQDDLLAALEGRPRTEGPHGLLWSRLAEVHAAYGLDRAPLLQLTEGARWDLEARTVGTRADLMRYCELVAGCVGEMMLPFLVKDRRRMDGLTPAARALGNAMQLTNILRDVGEDARTLGRVYLPDRLLAEHGVDAEALNGDRVPPGYPALMEALMAEAERLYDAAEAGIGALPGGVRRGIRSAARMYREILNGVRAAGYDNLTRRAVVPRRRKLRLVLQDDYARRRDRLRA